MVGDVIIFNEILVGDKAGYSFLVKQEMFLVTGFLCVVIDYILASITLKVHLFLVLINISNQLDIT